MKFWIDQEDFIYLFQLMKAAGIENDYKIIGNLIDEGRISVNGETVFHQRLKLKKGDVVEFRNHHVKIFERNIKGEIPEEFHRDAKTKGEIKHGKTKKWKAKPVQAELAIDDQINDLAVKVHSKFLSGKKTLACAESCTGGMLQEIITNQSGASEYFMGGIVSYSNKIKAKILKVKQQTIDSYGAVSGETAIEMVQNVQKLFQTDFALAITGIAGPTGGTEEKPVGTVYLALNSKGSLEHQKLTLSGTRDKIRKKACLSALKLILHQL